MFSVHCPRHGQEILLDNGRIRGLDTTSDGIVMTWECWCGHLGTTPTGRASHPADAARTTRTAATATPGVASRPAAA